MQLTLIFTLKKITLSILRQRLKLFYVWSLQSDDVSAIYCMSCPVCLAAMSDIFKAQVLGKYQAQYKLCNACGYLIAHAPHWLDEAYTQAIANADTGLVMRNITLANKISRILYWLLPEHGQGRYLDVAGGYGMMTRLMRDFGFDFYWSDKYCDNIIAPGFEYNPAHGSCSVVTAIEVLEHVVDPLAFIKDALDLSGAKTLIFTTELYEGDPPNPNEWWYYSFATGQHIGFFKAKTLEKLACDLDLKFYSANGIHLLSKEPINQFIFSLITNRYFSLFPPFLIRHFLGSRTTIDHEVMMSKLV
jgi:hypothetical protein